LEDGGHKNHSERRGIKRKRDEEAFEVDEPLKKKIREEVSQEILEHEDRMVLDEEGEAERRGMKRERDEEGFEEDGPLKKKVRKVAIQRQRAKIEQINVENAEREIDDRDQGKKKGIKKQKWQKEKKELGKKGKEDPGERQSQQILEESPLSLGSTLEGNPVTEVSDTVPGVPDATATHIPNEVKDQSNDNLPRQPEELNQQRTSDGQLHSQDPRIVETKAVTDVATTVLEFSDRAATNSVADKKDEIPEKNNSADLNQRGRRVDGSDNNNNLQGMDPVNEVQKNVSEGVNRIGNIETNASERIREAEKPKLEEAKLEKDGFVNTFESLGTTPFQKKRARELAEQTYELANNPNEIKESLEYIEANKEKLAEWLHKEEFVTFVKNMAKTEKDRLSYKEAGTHIYDSLREQGVKKEDAIKKIMPLMEKDKENINALIDQNRGNINESNVKEAVVTWLAGGSQDKEKGIPEPSSEGVNRLQQDTQMPRAIGVQGS
jgi:hypothetical protein